MFDRYFRFDTKPELRPLQFIICITFEFQKTVKFTDKRNNL